MCVPLICILWGAKWTKLQMARPQKTVLVRNVGKQLLLSMASVVGTTSVGKGRGGPRIIRYVAKL